MEILIDDEIRKISELRKKGMIVFFVAWRNSAYVATISSKGNLLVNGYFTDKHKHTFTGPFGERGEESSIKLSVIGYEIPHHECIEYTEFNINLANTFNSLRLVK